MLLSLVAHAVENKAMVGAHNTVVVRRMWEVLLYSPCMLNEAPTILLMSKGMWGEPYRVLLVWELMAPTTL